MEFGCIVVPKGQEPNALFFAHENHLSSSHGSEHFSKALDWLLNLQLIEQPVCYPIGHEKIPIKDTMITVFIND